MSRMCALAVLVAISLGADHAVAERDPILGDPPDGTILGRPGGKYPNVPTFTIPQGGYGPYRYGYCPPGGWWPRYDYYPGYYGFYPGAAYIDYRVLYGLRQPAVAAAPVQPAPRPARPPLGLLGPAPEMPDGPGPDELKRAWRYLDLGDRYLREGRLLDARNRYRRAEKQAPDLAALHFRVMLLEMATGRFEEAVDALRRGLELEPDWADSGFDLDVVYTEAGRSDVARLLANRLNQFPNDADALLLAGVLLHLNGDDALAAEKFRHAMRVTRGESLAGAFVREPPDQPPPPPAPGE